MDIETLRALITVVETGSIHGAARAMGLSRSLIRRRLESLEAELGVPLLHRSAVGVALTPAGSVALDRGRPLLEGALALVADARAAAQQGSGVIHVIEPPGMPLTARAQALVAIRTALPELRVTVRQVEDPMAHLHEPCDLILHEGPPPDRNTWFSRVLVRPRLRAVASPRYLEAHGTPQTVADLETHHVICWRRPGQRADAWPLIAGGSVTVAPWFVSPDPLVLWAVATAGGGIFLAPDIPLVVGSSTPPLIPVLLDQVGGEMMFRASSRIPSTADSRVRGVLEQVQGLLAGFPKD